MKLEIKESEEELYKMLSEQKTASGKERVQALYLLKSKQVKSIAELSKILARKRITLQRWLRLYREGGINNLLLERKSTGRPPIITKEVREKLEKELEQPEGFKSYEEIRRHLEAVEGIEVSYKVVHDTVHYQMKAKLKVPRPVGIKHDPEAEEEFKKKLPQTLETIKKHLIPASEHSRKIRYWCGDESRLGLKTEVGRLITLTGIKPLLSDAMEKRKLLFIWVSRTIKWRIFDLGILAFKY
jgi:transposase